MMDLQWLFLMLTGAVFCLSLAVFGGMHVWMVCKNKTTIESWDQPMFRMNGGVVSRNLNLFDLGSAGRNWRQVMGPSPALWFLPVFNSYVCLVCYI